jgi:outer membrane receptor for ferrienterochelin and colicins
MRSSLLKVVGLLLLFMIMPLVVLCFPLASERLKTQANLVGHVAADGEHLPYVSVSVKGTTIGTLTDIDGHFSLVDLPVGELTVVAQFVGYKPVEVTVSSAMNETREVTLELVRDVLGLEEVVVTGDRNARKRSESLVIVNSITPSIQSLSHAAGFGESLNYSPGLRLETNCQNCGFTQVRMNGLEGPYSQILINSRPVFSGLAGVYGLELIPSNMIERIEIVRGAGSAIYGSNAIAGTINLILRDPINNSYEVGMASSVAGIGMPDSGGSAPDNHIKVNASLVSTDFRTGFALYGFSRRRDAFDANEDGFSELTMIDNTTLGSRFYQRVGNRGKLAVDFFTINEDRRGGNRFDYPLHEADIAEAVTHKINTAAATYEHFTRDYDLLSVYVSAQNVDRASYYGANRTPDGYGQTDDLTYNTGIQYKAMFGSSVLTGGMEHTGGLLKDKKLGYFDGEHVDNTIVANQQSVTSGLFAQYDVKRASMMISLGGRVDHYRIEDLEGFFETKNGLVVSPRINLLMDVLPNIQGRLSYSKGFRAPQIFDEDLHIESSGSRRVIHMNSPDLVEENSHSVTASLDINKRFSTLQTRFLLEGFYTLLNNPFANEYGEPDENGTVIYTRVNASEGALVKGINFELNMAYGENLMINTGFTLQSNHFEKEQEFEETRFFRTPNSYGFMTADWDFSKSWSLSTTVNYTGSMLIPYFGPALADPEEGILRESDSFLELGLTLQRNVRVGNTVFKVFAGVKNILNSYQSDFDIGIDRDPGYMYGPGLPRTIQIGLTAGNNWR